MQQTKFDVSTALATLQQSGNVFEKIFDRDQVLVEIYKPVDQDYQKPHDLDEFYIIISGSGKFRHLENVMDFKPGDLFFVPAHDEHRFIQFTDDFATWVIFTGEVKMNHK